VGVSSCCAPYEGFSGPPSSLWMATCCHGKIAPMKQPPSYFEKLVKHFNRKDWWHVPPVDAEAYQKRGKFLASTSAEAEF